MQEGAIARLFGFATDVAASDGLWGFFTNSFIGISSIVVLTFLLLTATIDTANTHSFQPFYDDVIAVMGGGGSYLDTQANLIEANQYSFPINKTIEPEDNYKSKNRWYSFIPDSLHSISNFFHWLGSRCSYIFKCFIYFIRHIFAPMWFTFYFIRFLYLLGSFVEEDTHFLWLALSIIIVLILNLGFGVFSAHIHKNELTGAQYENKIYSPVTGYYHILEVLYKMAFEETGLRQYIADNGKAITNTVKGT